MAMLSDRGSTPLISTNAYYGNGLASHTVKNLVNMRVLGFFKQFGRFTPFLFSCLFCQLFAHFLQNQKGQFCALCQDVCVNKFSVKPSSQYSYATKCRVKSTDDENPMTHCDAVGARQRQAHPGRRSGEKLLYPSTPKGSPGSRRIDVSPHRVPARPEAKSALQGRGTGLARWWGHEVLKGPNTSAKVRFTRPRIQQRELQTPLPLSCRTPHCCLTDLQNIG